MEWNSPAIIARSECIVRSLAHWTGQDLAPGVTDPGERARLLFEAPYVLLAHGTEADPVFDYGNRAALTLWDTTWAELTRMPSRLTAEAPNREERARLMACVTRDGFIADYSGIRISKTGRRFRIDQATVWNLLTPAGHPCGQAAMFRHWTFLD